MTWAFVNAELDFHDDRIKHFAAVVAVDPVTARAQVKHFRGVGRPTNEQWNAQPTVVYPCKELWLKEPFHDHVALRPVAWDDKNGHIKLCWSSGLVSPARLADEKRLFHLDDDDHVSKHTLRFAGGDERHVVHFPDSWEGPGFLPVDRHDLRRYAAELPGGLPAGESDYVQRAAGGRLLLLDQLRPRPVARAPPRSGRGACGACPRAPSARTLCLRSGVRSGESREGAAGWCLRVLLGARRAAAAGRRAAHPVALGWGVAHVRAELGRVVREQRGDEHLGAVCGGVRGAVRGAVRGWASL